MGMGNFVLLPQPRREREPLWKIFVLLPEQDQPRTESTNGMGKDQQTLIFLSSSVENERC